MRTDDEDILSMAQRRRAGRANGLNAGGTGFGTTFSTSLGTGLNKLSLSTDKSPKR